MNVNKPADESRRGPAQCRNNTEGAYGMPLINVKVIEGVFSSSQRREIVQKLTDAMV